MEPGEMGMWRAAAPLGRLGAAAPSPSPAWSRPRTWPGPGGVKLCLDFYGSADVWLSGTSTRTVSGTIAWTRLAVAADPPAGAGTARVTLALADAKGTGLAWASPGNYWTASTDPCGNTLGYSFDKPSPHGRGFGFSRWIAAMPELLPNP